MTVTDPPVTALELLSDPTTALSLALTVVLLIAAYGLSIALLSPSTTGKIRTLFIWHLFDVLIHFILESSFVYHSLFTRHSAPHVRDAPYRVAGALFSDAPMAKLWQVYAKADLRWGYGEPNIVSMEILTVVGAGGLAAYVVYLIQRDEKLGLRTGSAEGKKKWFWMVILATMELYGGFMTFVPEWIIGSPALVTSNWVYKWLYLFFFNTLWVWFPAWIIWEGYGEIKAVGPSGVAAEKKRT
ncbi:Emopamil-binding protein [Kalaharituber pfeilii]|nr:Emopamil-binding protein [Kalaharituber pfeilii]